MAEKEDSENVQTVEITEVSDEIGGKVRKLCAPCKKAEQLKTAKVYCKTCKEYQCSDCTQGHGKYSYMSGHNVVDADHESAGKVDFDMKGMDRCSKHNKRLNFYCKTENKMCCSTCAISSHRKCEEVGEIEQFTDSNDTDITEVMKVLETQTNSASLFLENAPVVLRETKEAIKENISKIDKMKEKVIKRFDDFKEKFIADTTLSENGLSEDINITTNTCQVVLGDLNEGTQRLSEVAENGKPTHVFIALHVIKDMLETRGPEVENCHANLSKLDVSLEFNKPIESLSSGNGEIGSWSIKKVPASSTSVDLKYEPEPLKNTPVDLKCEPKQLKCTPVDLKCEPEQSKNTHVDLKCEPKQLKCTPVDLKCDPKQMKCTPVQLKLRKAITLKKADGDIAKPFYSGVDFLEEDRIVVADNGNHRCIVMNQDLVELGRCQLKECLYDVCAVSEERVAVSSNKKIYILIISKTNHPQLMNTLNTKVSYFSLTSIGDNTLVAGPCDYGRPARIVTLSGEESDFGVTFPDMTYKHEGSKCAYRRNDDTLVVTDKYNHTCYLYNINNNTRVDVQDERIKNPRGVFASSCGIVFVCSSATDSIVQLSHDGKVLGSFTLDVKRPYSIAVSKCGTKLLVYNSYACARKLQLFYID